VREREKAFVFVVQTSLSSRVIFFAHFHQYEDLFLFPLGDLGFCFLPWFLSGVDVVTILSLVHAVFVVLCAGSLYFL